MGVSTLKAVASGLAALDEAQEIGLQGPPGDEGGDVEAGLDQEPVELRDPLQVERQGDAVAPELRRTVRLPGPEKGQGLFRSIRLQV